jgi:hypothetical protein
VEEEVAVVVGAVAMYCGSNWSLGNLCGLGGILGLVGASVVVSVGGCKCGVTVNCGGKADRVKGSGKHRVVKEGVERAAVVVVASYIHSPTWWYMTDK